ncbi:hypothetical protein FIBSPDRAFT_1047592 [Athelia psychrophila]|uniref:Uncharacterized protein n=1 Tax=Athelia psychrophila TaxID=1759441 RepID=A0A166F2C9_9AGAM|nr:hypothetical protein FIBSPDRAFT_1047592 [Fibularhizoctonia sp. CBS 109695]
MVPEHSAHARKLIHARHAQVLKENSIIADIAYLCYHTRRILPSHHDSQLLPLAQHPHRARARAWDQTVISRGKGPDFWAPYVEEWDSPPVVDETQRGIVLKAFETAIGRFIIKKLVLFPISLYPGIGVFVSG